MISLYDHDDAKNIQFGSLGNAFKAIVLLNEDFIHKITMDGAIEVEESSNALLVW